MTIQSGGNWFNLSSNLDPDTINKLNPHGFVYQDDGDGPLQVSVTKASWIIAAFSEVNYAGSNLNTLDPNSTYWIYIDDGAALTVTKTAPSNLSDEYFLCAKVVTNATQVTSITNFNLPFKAYA